MSIAKHVCRRVAVLLMVAVCSPFVSARLNRAENKLKIDSINQVLESVKSSADSLPLLYDIYDLTPRSNKGEAGEQVLATARRADDRKAMYDMIRRLAALYTSRDTTKQRSYLEEVERFPSSNEKGATEAFLRLQLVTSQAAMSDAKSRQHQMRKLVEKYQERPASNTLEQMERLFTLVIYLSFDTPGETLDKNLKELSELLRTMQPKVDGLENMYHLRAAMSFAENNQIGRAIDAERDNIAFIKSLEEKAHAEGFRYRNYDTHLYAAYRRILGNYQGLKQSEIDDYYGRILKLADENEDVRDDLKENPRAEAYYLMGKGRYAEAVPLLQHLVTLPKSKTRLLRLYGMLLKAATETGNKAVMLEAALKYNELLEEYISLKAAERTRELQVSYDVSSLQKRNRELSTVNQTSQMRYHRIALWSVVGVAAVLLVLLLLLLRTLHNSRRLALNLQQSNDQLQEDRDKLQRTQRELIVARDRARKADRYKTDFINNMSHEVRTPLNAIVEYSHLIVDNLGDEKRKYLERYAQIVDVSASMLLTLVNDVLEIAQVENATATVQRNPTSINSLCMVAIESMKKFKGENVELRFANAGEPDTNINTDRRRVEQVLINLLSNGLKFTEEGFVELKYEINNEMRYVVFTVTDSGIGVPAGKEEQIFDRFEKLSSMTQGSGLGLSICRMVADLLHGKVWIDTSYAGPGARFCFQVPV